MSTEGEGNRKRGQRESGRCTQGTGVWPGRSSVWGLPLQSHFVGFWLGVQRVRHPAVCSVQGSVGGSTKAQLGPVPSLSGLPAGRKNCWQWASLPAHAHPELQADKGVEGRLGKNTQAACGLLEPLTQGG